ncbi:hypothetical protein CCO02nite_16940 [Cellulomonas composti]|uniref:Uncharacterized protein n=1 Tax=Cellulomonas composti TaxID=266130 RepID=A0A511JAM0_9CELL|nr:hypothetical protein CCO02nite_16940 [Cellulomonas composti]
MSRPAELGFPENSTWFASTNERSSLTHAALASGTAESHALTVSVVKTPSNTASSIPWWRSRTRVGMW